MSRLLTAIRAAVQPGAITDSLEPGDEPGAEASIAATPPARADMNEEGQMPDTQPTPGAENAGAGNDEAVARAAAEGKTAGAKAANERMGAILGAEGIKGDGKRMSASLDLALASTDMAADAVVAFVTSNVAAAADTKPGAQQTYEERRLSARALAQPDTSATASEGGNGVGRLTALATKETGGR